jgi:predicted deacylase
MAIELQSLEVVASAPGPRVLLTGGVHGDEWEPMAALRRLHGVLSGRVVRGRVRLIPCVNEAAFVLGARVAHDGLDLARTCPGNLTGSVTEQTAWALSQQIADCDYYVDLHTGGTRLQVWPLAGYMLHPEPRVLEAQRRMARVFGLPLVWGTDHRLNGRSLSVARDQQIPAIYCEYLGGGGLSEAGVQAYLRGCLNLLADLGMVDQPAVEPPAEQRVVEDSRPSAGHMQINHPTPMAGFFEPRVRLGEWVSRNAALGEVCDITGRRAETVCARYAGQVIVLHTYARIEADTSVAVVLEETPAEAPQ